MTDDSFAAPAEPPPGRAPTGDGPMSGEPVPGVGSASGPGADVVRTLVLPEDISPVTLLGARDEALRAVEGGFPDVDLHVRGTTVTITGERSRVDVVVLLLSELIDVARAGAPLTPDAVERAIGLLDASARPAEVMTDRVLTAHGRTVRPK